MLVAIVGGHRRQPQLAAPAPCRQGQADQTAGLFDHEVDLIRGGELGGDDDVPLVLAILGVHQDVGTCRCGRPPDMSSMGLIGLSFMFKATRRVILGAARDSASGSGLPMHKTESLKA